MKKIFAAVIVLVAASVSVSAGADQAKLDGLLKMTIAHPQTGKMMLGKAISVETDREFISCLLKSSDPDATSAAIKEAGGQTRAVIGHIMSVSIPLDAMEKISDLNEVSYIEAAKPMTVKMNKAREFTKVDLVQAGTGLDRAYNGTGVMVGIVDSALDWENTDFDGADGTTRICYLDQMTSAGGSVECSKSEIDDGTCSVSKGGSDGSVGHGTHVTGIAASQDSPYTGVAPQAFIAFAFLRPGTDTDASGTFSTTVLEGVDAIFTQADDFDLPCAINISLGTSLGAHDNTSLLEQGLNEAILDGSGNELAGRVVVDAAGNENFVPGDPGSSTFGGIHASVNVSAGVPTGWRMTLRDTDLSAYGVSIVDVWLDNTTECRNSTIEVKAYVQGLESDVSQYKVKTSPINYTADTSTTAADSKANIDVVTINSNPQNSRPEALIGIGPASGSSWAQLIAAAYDFDIIIRVPSLSCRAEMWLYPDYTSLNDFYKNIDTLSVTGADGYNLADGDSDRTTTIPGTASSVITVGSYMGRGTWTDINGNVHNQDVYDPSIGALGGTVGNASVFSSLGPTGEIVSPRVKPDVSAPGEPIISTLASGVTGVPDAILGNETHFKLQGSSMASPHVAGIAALMLEKNNCLTANQIKSTLQTTAAAAPDQTTVPDFQYGYGKVDALSAMQQITAGTSCFTGSTCGGGSDGGKGCGSMVVPVPPATSILSVLAIIVPIGLFAAKRRRK